jgi:hypothetical protein
MSIEIANTFSLMPIVPSTLNTLQRESAAHLPTKNSQNSIIQDTMKKSAPNTFWEKGIFIDLYI